jgi:DNA polymerase III, epsilon subunit and related 3''-5'' exonucleases
MEPQVAEALAVLDGHPDYRILRRLKTPDGFYNAATGLPVKRGIYLDCEASSAEPQVAGLYELALVPFLYETGGKLLAIREDQCVSFLNDPGVPITDEIRSLTGIAPEDIVGKSLDMPLIETVLADVDMVVAHNAGYDRKLIERYVSRFRDLRWACSWHDVPWRSAFHAPVEKLEVIAHFCGNVFYGAHRAMIDCIAGVHVLATVSDSDGKTAFEYLEESCFTESLRIWATGAPFETKDALRNRGYRWNDGRDGRPKAWHKMITPSEADEENQWLRVHCGAYPRVTEIRAEDRFSDRDR